MPEYTRGAGVRQVETHGTKEYRRDMAAIHDEVVRTGEPAIVTKDGKPYVKIVPATTEDLLRRLAEKGVVELPKVKKRPHIEPIDAGDVDTTALLGELRR